MSKYIAKTSISDFMLVDDKFSLENYVKHNLSKQLADFILCDLDKGEPMSHYFTFHRQNSNITDATDFWIEDRTLPIERQIYIPIYAEMKMPRDVYECRFCGGFTKNDRRGNCGACGAPRNK